MMKTPMAVFAALWLAACTPATPDTAASTPDASPAGPVAAPPAAAPASAIADDPSAVNQAIDEALGDHVRYEAVIRQLQQAVAANDAAAVAALVDYPFATVRDGQLDLVMIGRAHLANPHWPMQAARALNVERPTWVLPAPYAHWLERYRSA